MDDGQQQQYRADYANGFSGIHARSPEYGEAPKFGTKGGLPQCVAVPGCDRVRSLSAYLYYDGGSGVGFVP